MARVGQPQPIPARALILSPPAAPGAEYIVATAMLIVLPDGTTFFGKAAWSHTEYYGVVRLGTWVPVLMPPGNPGGAKLDTSHVPHPTDVAAVIAEALGGPRVMRAAYDEWRVKLALDYAERLIAEGVFNTEQAEAIRNRIKEGV